MSLPKILLMIALPGNAIYLIWVIFNGINDGFDATPFQKMSYFGLLTLLVINLVLLSSKDKHYRVQAKSRAKS